MERIVDELESKHSGLPSTGGEGGEEESLLSSVSSPVTNASTTHKQVKVHTHGEPDTNDKWFPMSSANLELLTVIPSEMAAIGAFPALHEPVELLLMDQRLYDVLLPYLQDTRDQQQQQLAMVGRVVQVLPAHDASVVDVEYPTAYHHVVRERRVHIGNGYLKVISEDEFEDRQHRLDQAVATAHAACSTTPTQLLHV